MRIVLDTNVVVAGLRSQTGAARIWLELVLERRHQLLISVPLILEYEAVLNRPVFLAEAKLTSREIAEFLDALCLIGERVELYYWRAPVLRDPRDEMVLATAIWGQADLLLTFNVRDFNPTEPSHFEILSPGPALLKEMED